MLQIQLTCIVEAQKHGTIVAHNCAAEATMVLSPCQIETFYAIWTQFHGIAVQPGNDLKINRIDKLQDKK